MNREAIRKTAICHFDEGENLFIVESPLLEHFIGAEKTEEKAWEVFNHFVDEAYAAYLEGKLGGMYAKRGRPAKNRKPLNVRVQSYTAREVSGLAAKVGCSQGEFVDYLLAHWKATCKEHGTTESTTTRRRSKATAKKPAQASKHR